MANLLLRKIFDMLRARKSYNCKTLSVCDIPEESLSEVDLSVVKRSRNEWFCIYYLLCQWSSNVLVLGPFYTPKN